MLKLYFKQAIELLRQHKLFSGIYIFGTALAIASTTIMAVVAYVGIAPLYPDVNRENVYYVNHVCVKKKNDRGMTVSSYSIKGVNEWFYTLKNKKEVSAEIGYVGRTKVKSTEATTDLFGRYTDPSFFRIYQFNFVAGRPFSASEFEGKMKRAVISDRGARDLFGSIDGAIGKTIVVNKKEFTVCGVFEEPSMVMEDSYAGVILPYTTYDGYDDINDVLSPYLGQFKFRILVENEQQANALRTELAEILRRYNSANDDVEIDKSYTDLTSATRTSEGLGEWSGFFSSVGGKISIVVLFILLLIPALNLSGLIAGRMGSRSLELGVRKSFGATRGKLLRQVLWENLLLTVFGGMVGFVLSWIVIYFCKDWVFITSSVILDEMIGNVDVKLSAEMIFAPAVFLFAFMACVVLNVMSAYIPARNALRRPIVESLNAKNN